ncbi:hypothetical protein [Senegalia massiliensis]|uniref:Late embryogenesis abundant protein LEA-2 subgroup domain-containing protein n=1 Tax=Senegalia massiliensis TaxID=1720316 RepID=A0A845R4M2_9CLOT|nr:hypothetical protein [Senegalia massiliensis]NBI08362.1 hypothetical protein [Senegalia massiliensis]
MIKYLTKENIALTLSIISIVLAVISFIKTLINEYVRLNISYISHFSHEVNNETTILIFMTITNKSRLPISLSSAYLEIDNKKYHFDWRPQEVLSETTKINNQIVDRKVTYTIPMPQTILGLGALGGYFGVETDLSNKYIEEHPNAKIILHTNKKILEFPIILSKNTKV